MKRLTLIAGLLLLFAPAPARADDASLGRMGETVFPIGEATVRMAAEEVLLKVGPTKTQVDLTFLFANDGPVKQVLMGFPVKAEAPDLHDFQTQIDGEPVAVRREQAQHGDYPSWFTWDVPFGTGQTRTVTNSYWGANSYWSNGYVASGYVLKTGALWKEKIGSAVVRAKLDQVVPSDLLTADPADYRWDGDYLVWTWREFEPERDISVMWNARYQDWDGNMPPMEQNDLIHRADAAGSPEDAIRLLAPHAGEPGIDLALLRYRHLAGDRAGVRSGVEAALKAGHKVPLVAYLGVKEGLLQPEAVLDWPLPSPLVRWVQDRMGVAGEAPVILSMGFNQVHAGQVPYLAAQVQDPDGDILDWGIKMWLQPDESLTPIAESKKAPALDFQSREPREIQMYTNGWVTSDEVWVRAWIVDGRGHRQDTGLVRLQVPAALKGETPEAPPASPDVPTPVQNSESAVPMRTAAVLASLGLAVILLVLGLLRLRRR